MTGIFVSPRPTASNEDVRSPATLRLALRQVFPIAMLLFGVKLAMIRAFGSDLPFWDQWDAEAGGLVLPFLDHGLAGIDWFAAHNAHRILTTRLFALAIFVANGQWDPLVECVFSACIHVACALALALFVGRRFAAGPAQTIFIALIVIGFGSPFGQENTISGFQCQFYFLVFCTLLMLMLASREHKTVPVHVSIVALGLAAYFSLAGGVFSCVAAAACILVASMSTRGRPSGSDAACAAALCVVAVAGFIFTPRAEGTTGSIASPAAAFGDALYDCLSFPTDRWAPLAWMPCLLLLVRTIRIPRSATRLTAFCLGLGLFVVLIAVGIASQRGGNLISRYKDLLWFGSFANLIAIYELALVDRILTGRSWRIASFTTYAIASSALLIGDGRHSLEEAAARKVRLEAAAVPVAAFVRTKDVSAFESDVGRLPHPSAAILETILLNRKIEAVLPPSVRPGLLDGPDAIAATDLRTLRRDPALPSDRGTNADAFGTLGLERPTGRLVSRPLAPLGSGSLAIRLIGTALPGEVTASIASADGERRDFRIRGMSAANWSMRAVSPLAPPFVFTFAQDSREPDRWVAFSGPVELGRLRRFCDFLLDHGDIIAAFGLASFLVLQAGAWTPSRR